jgi:hypothetical protein
MPFSALTIASPLSLKPAVVFTEGNQANEERVIWVCMPAKGSFTFSGERVEKP